MSKKFTDSIRVCGVYDRRLSSFCSFLSLRSCPCLLKIEGTMGNICFDFDFLFYIVGLLSYFRGLVILFSLHVLAGKEKDVIAVAVLEI